MPRALVIGSPEHMDVVERYSSCVDEKTRRRLRRLRLSVDVEKHLVMCEHVRGRRLLLSEEWYEARPILFGSCVAAVWISPKWFWVGSITGAFVAEHMDSRRATIVREYLQMRGMLEARAYAPRDSADTDETRR